MPKKVGISRISNEAALYGAGTLPVLHGYKGTAIILHSLIREEQNPLDLWGTCRDLLLLMKTLSTESENYLESRILYRCPAETS
jgi:hypothetical protein